jgi:hypothetical protein
MDDILKGIKVIHSGYEKHCRSERHIAENYFDSLKVLNYELNKSAINYSRDFIM